MKNSNIEIKEHYFLNHWTLEYQVKRKYFVMEIQTEDLETVFEDEWDSEKYDSPYDFFNGDDEQVEQLLAWFHTEYADDVEPIERNDSILYQYKIQGEKGLLPSNQMVEEKTQKVIFKSTFKKQDDGLWQEVPSPAYIKAIAERLFELEKEMQELKEEKEKRDDILLTTKQIEHHYQINPKTINQARAHNRIVGRKINGKEWGYEKREVDKYIEKSKNYFKNSQYAS